MHSLYGTGIPYAAQAVKCILNHEAVLYFLALVTSVIYFVVSEWSVRAAAYVLGYLSNSLCKIGTTSFFFFKEAFKSILALIFLMGAKSPDYHIDSPATLLGTGCLLLSKASRLLKLDICLNMNIRSSFSLMDTSNISCAVLSQGAVLFTPRLSTPLMLRRHRAASLREEPRPPRHRRAVPRSSVLIQLLSYQFVSLKQAQGEPHAFL